MLFTSFSQFVALVVLFFSGLVLGLGLHPGGKKWRQRFTDEREHYAQFRRDAEKRLRICNKRIVDLERAAAARTAQEEPAAPPAAEVDTAPTTTTTSRLAATAAVPAFFHPSSPPAEPVLTAEQPRKGWFGSNTGADLARIRGIDDALKTRLFGLGVVAYQDITDMSAVDEIALEQRLDLPAGYITREQWREQAALLKDGKDAEQADRFPPR